MYETFVWNMANVLFNEIGTYIILNRINGSQLEKWHKVRI